MSHTQPQLHGYTRGSVPLRVMKTSISALATTPLAGIPRYIDRGWVPQACHQRRCCRRSAHRLGSISGKPRRESAENSA
jgi:hypothetical protein